MKTQLNEKELLELCKSKIAVKFTYVDFNKWVNHDFIRLSEDILETTKNYLSPTSLKRIFGKISSDAFPKKTTLDILAQYIGHKDWNDFVLQNRHLIPEQSIQEQVSPISSQESFTKKRIIAVSIILLITLGSLGYFYFTKEKSGYQFNFVQLKSFSKAPFTAGFKVDISPKPDGEVVINFSDPFETDLKFTQYQLSETSQTVAHTYMIPGVYHPHLVEGKKILDSLDVPVYSDGWEWVVVNYHDKERAFHTIKDQSYFRKDGIFCVPSSEVVKYKVDTVTSYCMRYMNYQDFKTDPENLKLEMKICNPLLSHSKCTDVEVQLKFMHWNVGFMLFHKGCNGNYSRVQMGSTVLNGIDNDLSMFEVDLNNWQDVLMEIKNGKAFISVNGSKIFERKIDGKLGQLQGISINSQESAKLDRLKLYSPERVLLEEEF